MVGDHRNEFSKRRSTVASLPAADENGRLGTDHFYLQRIRCEHSSGNDPLRRDENNPGGARQGTSRNYNRQMREPQFSASPADPFGRRMKISRRTREIEKH